MGESSEALGAVKKEEASDHVFRQQTNTTDTAVTHHSLVSAVTQASASSSNPYQSTDNDDTADYRDISPYNPNTYKCQDYGNDQYQWFDGLPGGGKDQEFTIDLKDGSMDRLRDIRPYLYYVGFWSRPTTPHQPVIETLERSIVEDTYVTMGRRYLLEEQAQKRGYFLAQRDWASFNDPICQGFPFRRLVWEEPEESDHGFEEFHENTEYEGDCVRMVIKTNSNALAAPEQDN